MSEQIGQHTGRVVDAPGDNLLAEFASAVDAVQCAVEIQKLLSSELDRMNAGAVANVMRVGRRGGAKMFAGLILAARSRVAKQARELLTRVEQTMETETVLW